MAPKKKWYESPWVWVLAAGGAYLLLKRKTTSAMGTRLSASGAVQSFGTGIPKAPGYSGGGQAAYIRQLWAREQAFKPKYRTAYNIDRMRRITRAAARYFGVPAEWPWGAIYGESAWYPVGIYAGYRGTPKYAIARKTTAYGVGQILRGVFNKTIAGGGYWSMKKNLPKDKWWKHEDMLDPKVALWSVVAQYGRSMVKRGGGPGKSPAAKVAAARRFGGLKGGFMPASLWTTGGAGKVGPGTKRKMRQIVQYGPSAFAAAGKKAPSKGWKRNGPTFASDDVPPWGGAAVSYDLPQLRLSGGQVVIGPPTQAPIMPLFGEPAYTDPTAAPGQYGATAEGPLAPADAGYELDPSTAQWVETDDSDDWLPGWVTGEEDPDDTGLTFGPGATMESNG